MKTYLMLGLHIERDEQVHGEVSSKDRPREIPQGGSIYLCSQGRNGRSSLFLVARGRELGWGGIWPVEEIC